MTEAVLLIVGLVVGLIAGFTAAWLASSSRVRDTETRFSEAQHSFDSKSESSGQQIESLQQQLRAEAEQKIKAQTQADQLRQSLDEQKKLIQEAETRLVDTFSALSHRALASNNQSFLELAKSTFTTLQTEAKGDLETSKQAIDGLVKPLQESLKKYEQQIATIENQRQKAYGGLTEQLRELQSVTGTLNTALRNPQVRGRWGELTLRRAVEMAGMSEHCGDFSEQESLAGEAGRLRPDMIVNLPAGQRIVVDSKVPLEAYLDAIETSDEGKRKESYNRHSQQVRDHVNRLGAKSYWEQLDQATDFVVLFLPGEPFFAAALQNDQTLLEDAWQRRVLLASPATLIALLRTVAYGWRQEALAKNAQEISEIGKQIYSRIRTFAGHMDDMRHALGRAVEGFNRAAGSLESRVLVSARKLNELGAGTGDEIGRLEPLEITPRLLDIAEATETDEANEADQPNEPDSPGQKTPLRAVGGGSYPKSNPPEKRSKENAS